MWNREDENEFEEDLIDAQNEHGIQRWQIVSTALKIIDVLIVNGAYFLALWIRFDFRFSLIENQYFERWLRFTPIYTIVCLVIFILFRLYRSVWIYVSYEELKNIIISTIITGSFHTVGITYLYGRMPLSYYIIGITLQFLAITGLRFSYRFLRLLKEYSALRNNESHMTRCMLVGAGAAGRIILRDLHYAKKAEDRIVCIIDDDVNKHGRFIEGVEIVGSREEIFYFVKKYKIEKIIIAIPSARTEEKREIYNICKETGCILKHLPGVYEPTDGDEISASRLKDVRIEDLLGRAPIKVDMKEIYDSLSGKVILVTGGGGSIGSELCRQIAGHDPKKLIIFDIYENNAYEIEQELKHEHKSLDFVVEIGSVRDSRRIYQVFEKYHPDIVYHAAAHKHVPLMEGSPCEAIKNNVFGTYKTAYAAMKFNCQRFVLVSTDKAVNPTNIMGASKRLCEMVIQAFDRKVKQHRENEIPELHTHGEDSQFRSNIIPLQRVQIPKLVRPNTEFVAVRFGNVLGSNGSVVPLFKKMIAEGGPVEVTHKDIVRYFMTISEAVSLILQAGTYAKGGEIFVLDMGEPVKIDTLARNLIKLSGYTPDVDIKVVYVGLRPGEKLYEEKLMAEEGMTKTPNRLIHIGHPIEFDEDMFLDELPLLMEAAYRNDEDIKVLTKKIVSTYMLQLQQCN